MENWLKEWFSLDAKLNEVIQLQTNLRAEEKKLKEEKSRVMSYIQEHLGRTGQTWEEWIRKWHM